MGLHTTQSSLHNSFPIGLVFRLNAVAINYLLGGIAQTSNFDCAILIFMLQLVRRGKKWLSRQPQARGF